MYHRKRIIKDNSFNFQALWSSSVVGFFLDLLGFPSGFMVSSSPSFGSPPSASGMGSPSFGSGMGFPSFGSGMGSPSFPASTPFGSGLEAELAESIVSCVACSFCLVFFFGFSSTPSGLAELRFPFVFFSGLYAVASAWAGVSGFEAPAFAAALICTVKIRRYNPSNFHQFTVEKTLACAPSSELCTCQHPVAHLQLQRWQILGPGVLMNKRPTHQTVHFFIPDILQSSIKMHITRKERISHLSVAKHTTYIQFSEQKLNNKFQSKPSKLAAGLP